MIPRAAEYLYTYDRDRFATHEAFFMDVFIPHIDATYGVSTQRNDRAVFGLSNGAAFSAFVAVNYPDVFGNALIFSLGWRQLTYNPAEGSPAVRYVLAAGDARAAVFCGYQYMARYFGAQRPSGVIY